MAAESEHCIELGQFFILPEYQNKGIGTYLLKGILDTADRLDKKVALRFLRNNPVKSLYVRNSFRVVDTDEILCHMERRIGGGSTL